MWCKELIFFVPGITKIETKSAEFFASDKAALDFLSDAYIRYARREKSKTTQSEVKKASDGGGGELSCSSK